MSRLSRAVEQRLAQRRILRRLAQQVAEAFRLVRLGSFATTVPEWLDATITLIDEHAAMAGSLAADHYEEERDLADVPGEFRPDVPEVPEAKAERSLKWATKDLWVPEADDPPPIADRLESAETKVVGVAEKAVADVARDTVRDGTQQDRRARGWARVTSDKPCHFCALMSIRGPVYKSRETAGRDANAQFEGDGEYKFHDHCSCTVTPVFVGQEWEPPERVAQWHRLYYDATSHTGDKLNAWRKAYESIGS